MGIKENIKAREAAREVLELLEEEAKQHGKRFWQEIARVVELHVPVRTVKKKPVRPMTDVQAKAFGSQLLPFGEYYGKRVDDVPLARLQWYADQTFIDDLRRYLDSKRVEAEQHLELDE